MNWNSNQLSAELQVKRIMQKMTCNKKRMIVKYRKGFQNCRWSCLCPICGRGRWVTLGLRDELVKVTAVWCCHAQEPARVSKMYRLLDTRSQVGIRGKLLVQLINHLHMRRAGGSHTWTGNTEHEDFWSLHCRILSSACCIWGGRG